MKTHITNDLFIDLQENEGNTLGSFKSSKGDLKVCSNGKSPDFAAVWLHSFKSWHSQLGGIYLPSLQT